MLMNGRKYFTCNEILNGEYYTNSFTAKEIQSGDFYGNCCRHTIPENVQDTAFKALKSFVAATARGDRRRRILGAYTFNIKRCGILNRLWYYPESGKVEYCCGQEWYSEMSILRDVFDYKTR